MGTTYSLICWGGSAGKTIASWSTSTHRFTLTNNGLRTGQAIVATETKAGLTANTTYYANSSRTGATANEFYLYDTYNQAIAGSTDFRTLTGATSTLLFKSKYYLDISDATRWGTATPANARIYASIPAAQSARNTALTAAPSVNDYEFWEIGEFFDDWIGSSNQIGIPDKCAGITIATTINGSRTTAYHNNTIGSGYRLISATASVSIINPNQYNFTLDGVEVYGSANSQTLVNCQTALGYNTTVKNCIIHGSTSATSQKGIFPGQAGNYYNNIVYEIGGNGIEVAGNAYNGVTIYNNIVVKCTGYGITQGAACNVRSYNNISVGNATGNYGPWPPYLSSIHSTNFGDATADKKTATVTIATSVYNVVITAHGRSANQPITFTNSGGALPTVGGVPITANKTYYVYQVIDVNTIQVATGIASGRLTFDGNGTGTHYTTSIWSGDSSEKYLDLSTNSGNDVFVNYAGNDYRPAGTSGTPNVKALQVDTGLVISGRTKDAADKTVPNYVPGGSLPDAGALEFDHLNGEAPLTVTFTGIITGSTIRIFTTGTQTVIASSTSTSGNYVPSGVSAATYDYTIYKDGYLPIRATGVAFSDGLSITISQSVDRAFVASSGLSYGTTATINTSTKLFDITTATTGQNWYSFWIEQFRSNSDLYNIAFPLQANGPNSFSLLSGYEFDTGALANITRDGMRYVSTGGSQTAAWAAILTVGVSSGMRVRYQQTDGGTTQNAVNTSGNMDELIQIYGDSTHGNFDYRGYLVLKVQESGYDQAEADAVALYGNLEDQLYVVGLAPAANGIATGNPSLANPPAITDHGASPVTWNSKDFSITIVDDAAGNTGTDIMRWLRYYFETGGTFQGKDAFNWHDLVQTNGSDFKTVRGVIYGDTGATLKGVRVVTDDGVTPHPDFTLFTADDGTTYAPPVVATAEATVLAGSRVQLYNVTTDTEIDNSVSAGTNYSYTITTEASVGDTLRLNVCKIGKQSTPAYAVWAASGVTFLVNQPEDTVYTAWGIDGSTVTEFVLDVTGTVQIDANDVDGSTSKTRLGAWYNYILTTEDGIRYLYGAISFLAVNAIRINVDVLDLEIENINASTALYFTDLDVRLYRSDGTSIIAATSYSIHNDYSGVPDVVETGVSGLTTAESNQLFGIPLTTLTTDEHNQLMAIQTGTVDANIVSVNNVTVVGTGTDLDPWNPA